MEKKSRNLLIIILIILILGVFLYNILKPEVLPGPPHDVVRSFDKSTAEIGEVITVSLTVDVDAGDRVYSIEEVLPTIFKVSRWFCSLSI